MSAEEAELLLLVNARDPEESRTVLAADGAIHDLKWSQRDRESIVGNVYLGVVRQVEPGLDAAFVDFGGSRAGFLHVGNLHPGYAHEKADPFAVAATPTDAASGALEGPPADGGAPPTAVEDVLEGGQRVLVQVLRDPVKGKGATLSTFLSLAGRLLVLVPSLGRPGVSRRIREEEERERLRATLAELEIPEGLGVIARTAAARSSKRGLRHDLQDLLRQWERIEAAARGETAPALVAREASAAVRAVRDLYSSQVARVVVDDEEAAREIEDFLRAYVPRRSLTVERHTGAVPLLEAFDLERDYQLLFRARVPVRDGASVVIHETEALTAIDVNSGRIDKGSLEETAREANLVAAEEIARQIRLRDLGGILVVDFIDMQSAAHRREVESAFRKALRRDRARLKPGRLGSFGLMPLTRRRLGTGLPRATEWECRACQGTGTTTQHRAGALRVLRRMRAGAPGSAWRLRAHPGVLEALERQYGGELAQLEVRLHREGDPQVPPGEPVLDEMAGSG